MAVKHPTDVNPDQPDPAAQPDPAQPDPAAPDPDPAPAKVAPKRYAPGQRVKTNLYGTVDPSGRITPTAGGGTAPLEPGSRGNVIARAGDELTVSQVRILNA